MNRPPTAWLRWLGTGACAAGVGGLWAALWTALYALAAQMDRLEALGDAWPTVVGRVLLFHLFLSLYLAAATLIPLLVWLSRRWLPRDLSWRQRFLLLGIVFILPFAVGYGTLAWAARFWPWAARAWESWRNPGFAGHHLLTVILLTGLLLGVERRRRRRSPHSAL